MSHGGACCLGSPGVGRACPYASRGLVEGKPCFSETSPHWCPAEPGPFPRPPALAWALQETSWPLLLRELRRSYHRPGLRGTLEPFPVNEAVVCSILSQSPFVWVVAAAECKGEDSP